MNDRRLDEYSRHLKRLFLIAFFIALTGTVCFHAFMSAKDGWGFLLGTTASILNLWLTSRVASKLGPDGSGSGFSSSLSAFRLLLIACSGYVILKYLDVNILAALAGLFAGTVAVVVESILELVGAWRASSAHPDSGKL